MSVWPPSGLAAGDPVGADLVEDVEWDPSAAQDRLVEVLEVELRAQSGLGAGAQVDDGGVAELVAAGLAGGGAVPVHLARGEAGRLALVVHEAGDGLLARPAHVVDAG